MSEAKIMDLQREAWSRPSPLSALLDYRRTTARRQRDEGVYLRRVRGFLAANPAIDHAGQSGADNGGHPKEPKCDSAQPPTKRAATVPRAGFTEVLVTGMLIR
jgi:hypothetical protein